MNFSYKQRLVNHSKYNVISCEESHVCGHCACRQSCVGKKLCCFPRFSYFFIFRSSDSNAADVCFVVPLRTALRAITCDKHCFNSRIQTTETEISASIHIIGLYPVQINLGLRFIITIQQLQMISLDNSRG